jgi:excinuclease UvrABC nuclease subunit
MQLMPRRSLAELTKADLPLDAGVYAIYREGEPIYVGKASCLQNRVWKNHSGRGQVMTGSAFRRNVAEQLGIASAGDIKARRYQPTPGELAQIRAWIDACEVAWVTCASESEAVALEDRMKDEWMPPLTKR